MTKNKEKNRNPKGAGRKRKFSTNILKEIIDIYRERGRLGASLTFSEIAKFGREELGYSDLKYHHIANDKEVRALIEEYNDTNLEFKNYFSQGGSNKIINIDVIEFVNTNYPNRQKLILYLENYKKSYDMTIKELLKEKKKNREAAIFNNKLEEYIEVLFSKNKQLRVENKSIKEDYKVLSKKVSEIGEQELVKSLKSTGIIDFDDEKDENGESHFDLNHVDLNSKEENTGSDLKKFLDRFPELFTELE